MVVACWSVWVQAGVIAAVAVASALRDHGRFSTGISVMLGVYALLVVGVGVAAMARRRLGQGLLVGSGLLHVLVVVSLVRDGAPWWVAGLAVLAALSVIGPLRPTSRRWFGFGD